MPTETTSIFDVTARALDQLKRAARVQKGEYGLCWWRDDPENDQVVLAFYDDEDGRRAVVYTEPMMYKDEKKLVHAPYTVVRFKDLIAFDAAIPDVTATGSVRLFQHAFRVYATDE